MGLGEFGWVWVSLVEFGRVWVDFGGFRWFSGGSFIGVKITVNVRGKSRGN